MINTSEKNKTAVKVASTYSLAAAIVTAIAFYLGGWNAAILAGIFAYGQIHLIYILHLGLDLKKIQKQIKFK